MTCYCWLLTFAFFFSPDVIALTTYADQNCREGLPWGGLGLTSLYSLDWGDYDTHICTHSILKWPFRSHATPSFGSALI